MEDSYLVHDICDIIHTFNALAKLCEPSLLCMSFSKVYNIEKVAVWGGIEQRIIPVQSAFRPFSYIRKGSVFASFIKTG